MRTKELMSTCLLRKSRSLTHILFCPASRLGICCLLLHVDPASTAPPPSALHGPFCHWHRLGDESASTGD